MYLNFSCPKCSEKGRARIEDEVSECGLEFIRCETCDELFAIEWCVKFEIKYSTLNFTTRPSRARKKTDETIQS